MKRYKLVAYIEAPDDGAAEQVAAERLGPDEDYGFAYTIEGFDISAGHFSYHVSPARNRESIAREGLRPGSVFTDSERQAETFAEFYRSVAPEPYDVWLLDREGVEVEPDPDYTRAGIPGTWVAPGGVPRRRVWLHTKTGERL